MSTPLTAREAARLSRHAPPHWARWVPGPVILALGTLHVCLGITFTDPIVCTEAEPCLPNAIDPLLGGALLGLLPLGFLSLRLATAVVAAWLALEQIYDQAPVGLQAPLWVPLMTATFLVICAGLAWWLEPFQRDTGLAAVTVPPAPRQAPRTGWIPIAGGMALLLVSTLGIWLGITLQRDADDRARAARVVRAEVTRVDGTYIDLRQPGGKTDTIYVKDPSHYPVGSAAAVRVDDEGLVETVAEPAGAGDGWGLFGFCLPSAVGLLLLAYRRRRGRARLFGEAQPVHDVYVHRGERELLIYPIDAPLGSPAALQLAFRPQPPDPQVQAAIAAGRYDGSWHRYPAEPAKLYGQPVPGHWATIEVDGVVLTPTRPLSLTSSGVTFIPPYPWQR